MKRESLKEKKKVSGEIFEDIMGTNFPDGETINPQIHEYLGIQRKLS